MRVLITGGTGFVGRALCDHLVHNGHQITVLTRGKDSPSTADRPIAFLHGDPTRPGLWQEHAPTHDALINLAGTSIFGRWNEEKKKHILESRVRTTRNLVDAIPDGSSQTLISTSAVGYYGFHEDEQLDETSEPGNDFLAEVAKAWEAEAQKASVKGARVAIARFGIVLGKGGGALKQMVTPFKFFAGGPLGDGRQWLSWIHLLDLVNAARHLLDRKDLEGPFNFTAPNPATNRDFSKTLGNVLGRPSWLPAPGFMIKTVLGEFGSVILNGQRVIPKRLLENGFTFQFPTVEEALRDLL